MSAIAGYDDKAGITAAQQQLTALSAQSNAQYRALITSLNEAVGTMGAATTENAQIKATDGVKAAGDAFKAACAKDGFPIATATSTQTVRPSSHP